MRTRKTRLPGGGYAHDPQHTGRYVNPAIEPPVVSSISPTTGSYRGGDVVQIKGQNFMAGAKVFFDGIPATNVEVVDSTTLYATTPPHKPCFMYINDTSISPYDLSLLLVNQATSNYPGLNAQSSINGYVLEQGTLNIEQTSGCVVNVVVVHPSPDQREGVLRAGFTYTGYEAPIDNITLFVKKYSPMGTFENNAANWAYLPHWQGTYQDGLWTILDNNSNCIPKPYPSGRKVMYYGNKNNCNYNTAGEKNNGEVALPAIRVDSPDAKIRFRYFRDVEYRDNPYCDVFTVSVAESPAPYAPLTVLFTKNAEHPSELQWTQSPDLPIGQWVGKEIWVYFSFDTVDKFNNTGRGIAIDNIELIGAHWSPWAETSGEVILSWTGGLPKYLVYRNTNPDFENNPPSLRAYTPLHHKVDNTLNNEENYFYKVR